MSSESYSVFMVFLSSSFCLFVFFCLSVFVSLMMITTTTTMIMLPSQFRRTWECLRPQLEERRGECRRGNGVVAVAVDGEVCGDLFQIFFCENHCILSSQEPYHIIQACTSTPKSAKISDKIAKTAQNFAISVLKSKATKKYAGSSSSDWYHL